MSKIEVDRETLDTIHAEVINASNKAHEAHEAHDRAHQMNAAVSARAHADRARSLIFPLLTPAPEPDWADEAAVAWYDRVRHMEHESGEARAAKCAAHFRAAAAPLLEAARNDLLRECQKSDERGDRLSHQCDTLRETADLAVGHADEARAKLEAKDAEIERLKPFADQLDSLEGAVRDNLPHYCDEPGGVRWGECETVEQAAVDLDDARAEVERLRGALERIGRYCHTATRHNIKVAHRAIEKTVATALEGAGSTAGNRSEDARESVPRPDEPAPSSAETTGAGIVGPLFDAIGPDYANPLATAIDAALDKLRRERDHWRSVAECEGRNTDDAKRRVKELELIAEAELTRLKAKREAAPALGLVEAVEEVQRARAARTGSDDANWEAKAERDVDAREALYALDIPALRAKAEKQRRVVEAAKDWNASRHQHTDALPIADANLALFAAVRALDAKEDSDG